jgi:Ca2+-binding RTX toxin-like protein
MQLSDADVFTTVSHHTSTSRKEFTMCYVPPPSCGPTNTVNTGCGDDFVHVSKADGLLGCMGYYKVEINGQTQYMTKQQLENTQFNLGKGNDVIVVDQNVNADIHANGGEGHDVMIGGGGDDHFQGGKGNDYIDGRGGNDTIDGGRGHDTLYGGKGNDTIRGGKGNDYINGGDGHDWLEGNQGNDHIDGGRGWDVLLGGPGFDTLHGGPGLDYRRWS